MGEHKRTGRLLPALLLFSGLSMKIMGDMIFRQNLNSGRQGFAQDFRKVRLQRQRKGHK